MINDISNINAIEFQSNFNNNFELLVYRLNKLKTLSPFDYCNHFEWLTYSDSIITQFRAMFMENQQKKTNYTYQIFLKDIGENEKADAIDKYLDQAFFNSSIMELKNKNEVLSIRSAVKFIADKFICHYDNVNSYEKARMNLIMATLSNFNNKSINNLDVIVRRIVVISKTIVPGQLEHQSNLQQT